ncbi:MAG: hypothetical protein EXR73_00245 [Myxococcales bacterium]|nr:hypothetical protein [Myxococcales bacterium]
MNRPMTTKLLFALALTASLTVGLALMAPRAHAQAGDGGCSDNADTGGKRKLRQVRMADGTIKILDALAICGKAPKPSVLSYLQSESLNYEWENTRPNFLKKVHEHLSKSPF